MVKIGVNCFKILCNFLLTNRGVFDRIIHGDCEKTFFQYSAAVAQSVERRIGSAEVTGPIPVSSLGEIGSSFYTGLTRGFLFKPAAVAQSVERRIGSAEVTGPIPVSSLCNGSNPCICMGLGFF